MTHKLLTTPENAEVLHAPQIATGNNGKPALLSSIASAISEPHLQSNRFTLDGSETLEKHLAAVCDKVSQAVRAIIPPKKLAGLLLAGGYGRGEGGVLRTKRGDSPYNDLEFYVFVRGHAVLAEQQFGTLLHRLGKLLSPAAGLEVEFKVLTLNKFRAAGPSMFYYDLIMGHRWLIGDDALLAGCEHHRDATQIPLHEATRLLMNRCSGLLFSAERLRREQFTLEDSDFVGHNLAKAQLALGDVLLAWCGQYHWSCRVRNERLPRLSPTVPHSWLPQICQHHTSGVTFKLLPQQTLAAREVLALHHEALSRLAEQVWLWLEQQRLGKLFSNVREYALSPFDKCPETSALRNRLVNAKVLGVMAAVSPGATRYPRQRLLHALSLLLWDEDYAADTLTICQLQRELRTSRKDFAGFVAAYEQLWHRFN